MIRIAPLLVAPIATPVLAGDAVAVANVAHRVINGPDSEGDVLISVKADVTNLLDTDQEVEVWVQALDAEGFEVTDIELSGRLAGTDTCPYGHRVHGQGGL